MQGSLSAFSEALNLTIAIMLAGFPGPKRSLLLTRRLRSNDDLDALQPSVLHRTAPMVATNLLLDACMQWI